MYVSDKLSRASLPATETAREDKATIFEIHELTEKFELEDHHFVALCGWAAKADDSIVCFGAKPDKGFLDMKSRHIRKWKGDAREAVDDATQERAVGGWTAERRGSMG